MPTIYLDKGPAYGVGFIVASGNLRISEYLQPATEHAVAIANSLRTEHSKVAVLETVRISDERRRGQGFGQQILDEFMARCRAEDVSALLLVADIEEEQRPGFRLDAWYARNGFTAVLPTHYGVLYAYPEHVAATLVAATALQVQGPIDISAAGAASFVAARAAG
jgi:N-acetylglutamate synthase-like GNAT family acetyltransferase